jgi:hypothetical protein
MEIEAQRWFPLSGACALTPGGFGWHLLGGYSPSYTSIVESTAGLKDDDFLFDVEYKGPLGLLENPTEWIAGAYLKKSCTEFASYPDSWSLYAGTPNDVASATKHAFQGKEARILDLDVYYDHSQLRFAVILVPNYGPATRKWWWGHGATAQNLSDVLNGQAWGDIEADKIKKKIVALERDSNGDFAFVLNELQPGEGWWWGFGASLGNITSVLNGEAWGNFSADKISKRLVSLKRFAAGNWTFIALPKEGHEWWWYPWTTWTDLSENAEKHKARIIDIERYGSSDTLFSAILLANT